MLSIKQNAEVSVKDLQPEILLAAIIVRDVYLNHGHDCVITPGFDGKHMAGSKHYSGLALDFRTSNIDNPGEKEAIAKEVEMALGGKEGEYDVVLEGDHLHVEYDPV